MGEASVPDRGGPDQFSGRLGTPEVLAGSAPSMTLVRRAADWARGRWPDLKAWQRVAVVSMFGAALVAGALTVTVTRPWQVRPGPFDPTLHVELVAGMVDQADPHSLGEAGNVWASSYTVGGLDPTARYVLVGVSGPGLVDPMTVQLGAGAAAARQPIVELGATLACADARLNRATSMEYRAVVSRIDAFGRSATASLPLGDSGVWRRTVLDQCLARDLEFALQITDGSARIVTHPRRVSVATKISNPLPYGIVLRAAPSAMNASGEPLPSARTELPAGSTTQWTVDLTVGDCAASGALTRINIEDNGIRVTRPALTVFAALAGDRAPSDEYFDWLVLPERIADPVDGLLRTACAPARQ